LRSGGTASPDGYELRGRTSSGGGVELRAVNGAPGDPAPGLGSTTFAGRHVRLSTATDLGAIPGAEFLEEDIWKLSDDLPRAIGELAAGEQLLREHGPEFHDWVAGVVRQALFTDPGPGLLESGSSRLVPGFVHVAHGEALAMAEMLTHELSHQYYYLATRLGPVDDGSDSELYWSPVKQTGRPIANILLAYHAFGNVLLLMRSLLANAVTPAAPIESNAQELAGQLIELQRGLDTTRALTDVGLGLYDPLRDALELDETHR
jgi:HEXXH motif-containing protein